jgi:hypothetical protein
VTQRVKYMRARLTRDGSACVRACVRACVCRGELRVKSQRWRSHGEEFTVVESFT